MQMDWPDAGCFFDRVSRTSPHGGIERADGWGSPLSIRICLTHTHRASPPKSEKSLVFASFQANKDAAKQMRRLFGPCGGAGREDVLVAADAHLSSEVE